MGNLLLLQGEDLQETYLIYKVETNFIFIFFVHGNTNIYLHLIAHEDSRKTIFKLLNVYIKTYWERVLTSKSLHVKVDHAVNIFEEGKNLDILVKNDF